MKLPRGHGSVIEWGSSAERYDSLDRWLSHRLMSVSNRADESDRKTANNSMFKQRPASMYTHIQNHNTVIWSDKAGKQRATPGRTPGKNAPLAKQITNLDSGERGGASGYVKRTWCEHKRETLQETPIRGGVSFEALLKRASQIRCWRKYC